MSTETPEKTLAERVEELKRLRESATQGEWKVSNPQVNVRIRLDDGHYVMEAHHVRDLHDAVFIAYAANNALAIIREYQQREKELIQALKNFVEPYQGTVIAEFDWESRVARELLARLEGR